MAVTAALSPVPKHSVETTHTPQRGDYAWWGYIIDIRCHPGRMCTNVHTWARSVGPMIVDCIQHVTIDGDRVRAKSATCRVEDNVLHVITNYAFRVVQQRDVGPAMETLAYGQRIKQ